MNTKTQQNVILDLDVLSHTLVEIKMILQNNK